LLLLATMVVAGDGERLTRLRANPLWWPVVAYLAWTLLVLAFGRHYPERPPTCSTASASASPC
jgi:O-antigen ligase